MSNEFKLSANDISALKMLGLGDNIANIEKQIGKMPGVLRRQKENEINKLYKNEPRKAKKALAEYDYNVALNSGDADAIKQSGKNLAKAEQEAATDISTLSRTANAIQKGSQAWVDFFPWANQKIAQGAKWLDDKGVPFLGDMGREIHKALDSADTLNAPLNKINPLIAIPEMLNRAVGNEPSKKESDKERLARPNKLKEQQEILDRAYHTENPNSWNIAGTAGEFLAPAELATFAINAPIKTGGNFLSRVLPNFYKNALVASAVDLPANASDSKNFSDFGTRAGLGLVGGGLLGAGIGEIGNKIANRSANKIANENGLNSSTAPNTAPNSNTAPNTAPNSNADDLATNGIWLDYGSTPPPNGAASQKIGEVPLNITAIENLKTRQNELNDEIKSANELLKKARTNKTRKRLKEQIKSANDELKALNLELQKPITSDQSAGLRGFDDDGLVRGAGFATDPNSAKAMNANEIAANEAEILGSSKPWKTQKGELVPINKVEQGELINTTPPPRPLKTTDDIIDLVPDENGVYGVAYNGSSKELAKIATEIAKGEIQSLGAKRLVFIADNLAETAAKDAEQKISANIAKIDDDSVELYANNTALLADIAKKYPMLNKDEQIELANKQILANASAELLEYSKFLNGGTLPNDARLLGKNAGRMILKSLNAGASKQEIIDMLLKAGISGRNSTAAKALIQTGDINAYNAQMRQGEAELIAELSQNVRVAAKNESIGAILGSAKEKAIKNDELLKKGMGNQGLDDVINTFKSSKSGKEFEVAENGFGRELLSYDGQVANEEMKRSFLAWEAQEKKADITLHDGRKVVFLEPDEAVQLSYGNSYLYGEKDLEALFARRRAESLEQKLKRLQSHPAYENLLKMRENTKASELKGDTVGGSKPTVFYEPQSERYLRTQGGGGLPNAERSITITKADVAKLRASKADVALATKLENNLEALTGDPAASGLIDDLLTRDYHLASAAKKSELVAPKNADEVAGNSKIPSDETVKTAENAKTQKSIYEKYDEFNKLSDAEQTKKYKEMSPAEKAEFHAIKLRDNTHGYEVINRINYNKGWGGGSVRAIQNDKSIIPRMMTLNRIKTKKQATEILEGQRKIIEEKGNITPIKEFGTNYAEFYHSGYDAIRKLLTEKQGQVAGAFYDERFGDVGIVWGVEGTAKSDGWGIAKIAKYHPEALEKMEEMLKMPIIAQSENRIKLSDGKYFMSIRKDFNGEKQNWVLTAFEKEESKSVSGRRTNLSATQSASEKTTSQNTHTKNSTTSSLKSQELSMRESFSPELKASYDMRDKLLKSTNEVRASLNEKGKAELEKLASSKDSKLSRDAQIMKTLENAKSNPARYAKLKKLYLDENGKVKDSIGLC